uniref:NSRP1_N domain-containing protein n=1 Tax=Panagrellus redivivus TaxID=6233 RepID=A0A7E4VJK3_PANRE
MSDDAPKKFGLTHKGNSKQPSKSADAAALFNSDSDDDSKIKEEKDASKRFTLKYGSNQSRDKRAVEQALTEDPNLYEYDSVYDDIQARRNAKTEAQIEADKERKPKYADKIVMSAQKRQFEQLMVDERKQQKLRESEGDEFADKETFVTAAYQKQIEAREQARKELEERDRLDNRLKVEDQEFWRTNFNRKILDDLDRTLPAEIPVKPEVVEKPKKGIYDSSSEEEPSTDVKPDTKNFDNIKPGLNLPKVEKPPETVKENHRRDSGHDDDYERRRRHRRRRRHDSDVSSPSESEDDSDRRRRRHKSEEKSKNDKPERRKTEKEILLERLEKVKEILKQRNDASAIFMARERFLQRKAAGIVPPKLT